jgi:hypothetical protein
MALWQFNDEGVLDTLRHVVFRELQAETADLDAHRGILTRIVVGGFTQCIYPDRVLLQLVCVAQREAIGKKSQEPLQGLRIAKCLTMKNAIDLEFGCLAGL